jgi:iron complex transport system ATP-binding protein
LSSRERARCVAVVPQETHPVFDFTVEQIVRMGRAPHLRLLGLEKPRDRKIAGDAMERCAVIHLAGRSFRALSGGERQMVLLARALAQEARLLLLDEPTAFLDLKHRLAVYALLGRLHRENGLTVVVVSHDINLAARHCDRLVLLRCGAVAADGTPCEVLRPDPIRSVYEVEVEVGTDPSSGRPFVIPLAPS